MPSAAEVTSSAVCWEVGLNPLAKVDERFHLLTPLQRRWTHV
jgi:hypothetical protein